MIFTSIARKSGNLSGSVFRHLKLAYERDGREGVQSLLRESDANGKPRVTAREDIIKLICQWFSSDIPQIGHRPSKMP